MIAAQICSFLRRVAIPGVLLLCAGSAYGQIGLGQFGAQGILQGQAGQNFPDQIQNGNQIPELNPTVQNFSPVRPEAQLPAPRSRLEDLYTSRLPVQPPPQPAPVRDPLTGQFRIPAGVQPTTETAFPLSQFGYDIFGIPTPFTSAQIAAPQDNYILGPGDQLIVVLRGTQDGTFQQRVNRDGQILLPRLNPIAASGRTLAEVRADLERRVAQTYISTNAFISLGEMRQISVLVTGDVRSPGMRIVSPLATPLDAILLSGGIAKTGSLRNVTLIRGNQTRVLDLYSVLTQADAINLEYLENGDRIFVPVLHNTVAVAGLVTHPAIYELQDGQDSIDVDGLIKLAGGYTIGGAYRLSKISLEPNGSTQLVPLPNGGMIKNGEILLVNRATDMRNETVSLKGAVRLPNTYPLTAARSVHELLHSASDLDPDAYTPFALIVRRDLSLNVENVVPFSLARVLSGQQDIPLQNEDVVYVLKYDELRQLADGVAQQTAAAITIPGSLPAICNDATSIMSARLGTAAASGPNSQSGTQPGGNQGINPGQTTNIPGQLQQQLQQCQSGEAQGYAAINSQSGQPQNGTANQTQYDAAGQPLSNVRNAAGNGNSNTVAAAYAQTVGSINQQNPNARPVSIADVARDIGVPEQILASTLKENLVWLFDEVKDPGAYLAARDTTLADLVQTAGGPLRTADLTSVEVTSTNIDAAGGTARTVRTDYKGTLADFNRVVLQPLDVVRFRPVFSDRQEGRVTIRGEVRYPGTFDVRRGEKLSSVLARAGGLTDEAYPMGAIFTRRSAAVAESEANQREAKELEQALAFAAQKGSLTSAVASPTGGSAGATEVVTNLVTELRTTPVVGRITVTADPALLSVHPEQDIPMEAGDMLYIPKRPSTVTVTGEVLNSGSFAYQNNYSVNDYIALSGGTRESADDDRIFIVLPDGTARPVQESWLSFNNTAIIPPGSTIVVPQIVAPFSFATTLTNIASITQLVSSLAITAVSLKLLGQ